MAKFDKIPDFMKDNGDGIKGKINIYRAMYHVRPVHSFGFFAATFYTDDSFEYRSRNFAHHIDSLYNYINYRTYGREWSKLGVDSIKITIAEQSINYNKNGYMFWVCSNIYSGMHIKFDIHGKFISQRFVS